VNMLFSQNVVPSMHHISPMACAFKCTGRNDRGSPGQGLRGAGLGNGGRELAWAVARGITLWHAEEILANLRHRFFRNRRRWVLVEAGRG